MQYMIPKINKIKACNLVCFLVRRANDFMGHFCQNLTFIKINLDLFPNYVESLHTVPTLLLPFGENLGNFEIS